MFWGWLPFVSLSFGFGTQCNNILVQHHCNKIAVTTTNADTSARCNTVVNNNICGANVIIMIGIILITAPNAVLELSWYFYLDLTAQNTIPDCLFINPLWAHTVFERSTDREWHNPSGTSSDSRGDPLEQCCLGVGNARTRRTLRQNEQSFIGTDWCNSNMSNIFIENCRFIIIPSNVRI